MYYVSPDFEIIYFRKASDSQRPCWVGRSYHYAPSNKRIYPACRCFQKQSKAIQYAVDRLCAEQDQRRKAIKCMFETMSRLRRNDRIRRYRRMIKNHHDRLRELKRIKERVSCGA